MARTAYHYMPLELYRDIRDSQDQISPTNHSSCNTWCRRLSMKPLQDKYIFAFLDNPKPRAWEKRGLLYQLKETIDKPTALVSFKLYGLDTFVFEHEHLHWLNENHRRIRTARKDPRKQRNKALLDEARNRLRQYADSRTPLRRYDGEFEVPELAVESGVPSRRLTLEKILRK